MKHLDYWEKRLNELDLSPLAPANLARVQALLTAGPANDKEPPPPRR